MQDQPPLLEQDIHADPLEQFRRWYVEAQGCGFLEPTAVALATASIDGRPGLRMVLLKDYGADGFVFYSNYASRKGEELKANPQASLLWWWDRLYRQVRVDGVVEKLGRTESEDYFHTRPRGSQISALASPQSRPLADRATLEARVAELEKQYADAEIPLPADWGGYRLRPQRYEFWQGRRDRLHDRLCYQRDDNARWHIERIGP